MLAIPKSCFTPSRCIQLLNMFNLENLFEKNFVSEIEEDVKKECLQFGAVESIKIPLPKSNGKCSSEVGKVLIKFFYQLPAKQARFRLNGRTYNNRTVIVSFYSEVKFNFLMK